MRDHANQVAPWYDGSMEGSSNVKPGDLARVVRLPKYWGAADIRGNVGVVIGHTVFDPNGIIRRHTGIGGRWFKILIEEKLWTVPSDCLEVISETG